MKKETSIHCSLGHDIEYTLYAVSPDSSTAALSASTSGTNGILLIDTKSGTNVFVNQYGKCEGILFSADYKLCFLRTDDEAGLKHIIEYNML